MDLCLIQQPLSNVNIEGIILIDDFILLSSSNPQTEWTYKSIDRFKYSSRINKFLRNWYVSLKYSDYDRELGRGFNYPFSLDRT